MAYIQFYKSEIFKSQQHGMTSSLCFSLFVYKAYQKQPAALKLCKLIVYLKFYKIYKSESHVTRNDVIIMLLPKNNGKQ